MKKVCLLLCVFLASCALHGESIKTAPSTAARKGPSITGPVHTEAILHRRLIWTEDPQTRAVVCWDTATKGDDHRVYYDTESRGAVTGDYRYAQATTADGPYRAEAEGGSEEPDLYYHHAQLTGLEPGTTYYFVMASGGAVSREFHFRTAPATDEPLKIIFGGDSRTDVQARQGMNRRIAALAEEDDAILAFAHGGDYVGSGARLDLWKRWMDDHELTITPSHRMLPLICARGNHEGTGPLYDRVMAFAGGEGKNYFETRLSPEIDLITLNSCIQTDGPQKDFLEKSLAGAADLRRRVVQYHRPVYPAVKSAGPGLTHWVPLFEKYDVALACEADGHCIKRTVPIRNGKPDPSGVVYIGEGGLGVGQRTPKADLWYAQPPGMVGKGHHVQLLSFTKDHLEIQVVGMDGNVLDRYAIPARGGEQVWRHLQGAEAAETVGRDRAGLVEPSPR